MKVLPVFAREELERNLACVLGGQYQDRRENIGAMPNAMARIAEFALLGFATKFPERTATILARDITSTGYRYAGAGSEHTSITDGKEVIKIHRKSVSWDEAKREDLVGRFTDEHRTSVKYLGDMVVAQTTSSGVHPLNFRQRAVRSVQDFIVFEDTKLFHPYDVILDRSRLAQVTAKYPGSESALHDLADAGLRMFDETGLLLDTSGLHNIVVVTGETPEVRCLDGTPTYTTKQSDIARITGQLTLLRDATN